MTVYSRTAQFETMLSLSVTHSCLLNFIELRRWPSREALYRATLHRGQRHNISVAHTVWTFFRKRRFLQPPACTIRTHLWLSHNTFDHLVRKKRKVPESGPKSFFCHSSQWPITTIHTIHVLQVSTFLCALRTEHHCSTAGVQGSLFLFCVRVCDLLEWMPSAPLHTCPHLHASAWFVCHWASILGDTQCSASASSHALYADFSGSAPNNNTLEQSIVSCTGHVLALCTRTRSALIHCVQWQIASPRDVFRIDRALLRPVSPSNLLE